MSATTTPATTNRRVPLDKRKRTETSCDKCKSRKQKCRKDPGEHACRYCLLHHIDCQTTQPRKKRLYGSVEGLGNRLALLESLVKGMMPEADLSNLDELRQLGTSLGIPVPDAHSAADNGGDVGASNSSTDIEEPLPLLPDQQGQVQYTGPSSSFSFHLKIRSLLGRGVLTEFVLFGPNPAHEEGLEGAAVSDGDPQALSPAAATPNLDPSSPASGRASSSENPSFESLIGAYFEHINLDFPVLHEASFREAYEQWMANPAEADPSWLCSFLCVLLLSRRVVHVIFPEDQERLWWRRVQLLFPIVFFTSSVTAVQALMLAALHLHNTNHRDACWNLTGTAVRIAFAIGLHQDKVNTMQTPLARELRKRLWWTLYAFEQTQVSSYDRPSAIGPGLKVGSPNERIIGMASYCPPDYMKWFNRLVVLLGSACRAPKYSKSSATDEFYVGPLSPAAGVLRELVRWKESIPPHLQLENAGASPPSFQRPLLLLHSKYHYTVTLLCRAALLTRATSLLKEDKDSENVALIGMADSCVGSGRALARALIQLDSIGRFNAVTWWDIWYSLAAASILVLDVVCRSKEVTKISESRALLSELAALATKHRRNPCIPGTIDKWASITVELYNMVDGIGSAPPTNPTPLSRILELPASSGSLPRQQHPSLAPPPPFPHSVQSATNGGTCFLTDTTGPRYYSGAVDLGNYSNIQMDRSTQMGFMDFTLNNIQEWSWNDLGSLLGNDHIGQ